MAYSLLVTLDKRLDAMQDRLTRYKVQLQSTLITDAYKMKICSSWLIVRERTIAEKQHSGVGETIPGKLPE